jgi:hypothetical protein
MAETTGIQWVDGTVNPTMGCDGCELWNKQRKIWSPFTHTDPGE